MCVCVCVCVRGFFSFFFIVSMDIFVWNKLHDDDECNHIRYTVSYVAINNIHVHFLPAPRFTSALYAVMTVTLCLSVCPSVRYKPVLYESG